MRDELFFDTNILAYFFDETETDKRRISAELIQKVFKGNISGCISNQVLAEFYVSITERLRKPLPKNLAFSIVDFFINSQNWRKVNYDVEAVKNALDILEDTSCSIWDAIIIETMKKNGISKIFTEDKIFSKISGITAINPFEK